MVVVCDEATLYRVSTMLLQSAALLLVSVLGAESVPMGHARHLLVYDPSGMHLAILLMVFNPPAPSWCCFAAGAFSTASLLQKVVAGMTNDQCTWCRVSPPPYLPHFAIFRSLSSSALVCLPLNLLPSSRPSSSLLPPSLLPSHLSIPPFPLPSLPSPRGRT